MWKLVPAAEGGPAQLHHLLTGVEYVVGRKNCAVLIQNDQSISRSHAVLSVSQPQMNLSQTSSLPVLTLKDTSKYGTFLNGEKLRNGIPRSLKSGDRITFGVFESKFRVEYEPLVVCSSCLDVSQKNMLNNSIHQLGGHVVNEWKEECTHLVMVSVKITVKTICALICGRPIVKPEYFAELIKAIEAKKKFPTPESFYPPVNEPSIKNEKLDLTICPGRKTIFKGKTFVFLTAKQYAKLSPAIKLGGGEAKLVTSEDDAASLTTPDICVIEIGFTHSQASISDVERKWKDTVTAVLERRKYRTISEAEIGLAVVFASTENYCNPQASLETGVKPDSSALIVQGPSLSQPAVVDETVMPSIIGEITAYVADTEMDQLMDTCMELTEEKRNKGACIRRKRHPEDINTVKVHPAGTSTVNVGGVLPTSNRKPGTDQNISAFSPSKISGCSTNKQRDSQQLNSITNYFQIASKKRGRNEDGETSLAKYAKKEVRSSEGSGHTQPVNSLLWENNTERFQKGLCTLDQKTDESSCIDTSRMPIIETKRSEKSATESILSGQPASKKRKELDGLAEDDASLELVFASQDLDWEEDIGDLAEQKSAQGAQKKRKLENKESISTNPEALKNPDTFAGGCNLPSRLLLTEFRSLVVSESRKDVQCATKRNYGHLNNFKKFKKVAYPGAGQLPHIIGGSDLIAAHARKDSEMEEWLRQEMEEQTRHDREESLADDLFRYDPRVKRR
ncbi:nibrin isoform X2 [Sceloporus undulatus]|uniref:nibrin isoform X2 n=1 Tax=Sceloporus undulatus TaxID=8520 RepID=UPI001C4CED80|nr:nibrin isoform X2 [Sceloporus undulatus]